MCLTYIPIQLRTIPFKVIYDKTKSYTFWQYANWPQYMLQSWQLPKQRLSYDRTLDNGSSCNGAYIIFYINDLPIANNSFKYSFRNEYRFVDM